MNSNVVYGKGMWKQQKEENNNPVGVAGPFKHNEKTKKNKVYCDDCGQDFIINNVQEKYLGSMLTVKYFECPNCHRRYVIGMFDNKSRRLGEEAYQLHIAGKDGLADMKMLERKKHLEKLMLSGNRYD